MKSALLTLALLLAASLSCQAKVYQVPADHPVIALNLPPNWNPTAIQRGYQMQTEDQEVYLSVEATSTPEEMTKVIDETDAMLKSHKVTVDKTKRKDRKTTINGLSAEELLFTGHDEDGPTVVSITFVVVGKSTVVFTYWTSVSGQKKHQAEFEKIVGGLRAVSPSGTAR